MDGRDGWTWHPDFVSTALPLKADIALSGAHVSALLAHCIVVLENSLFFIVTALNVP